MEDFLKENVMKWLQLNPEKKSQAFFEIEQDNAQKEKQRMNRLFGKSKNISTVKKRRI